MMAAVLHAGARPYAGDRCAVVGSMMASLVLLVIGTALWAAKLPAGATLFLFGVAMFSLSLTALALVYRRGTPADGDDPSKTDAPPAYRMSWRKSFIRRMSTRANEGETGSAGIENHTIVELSPNPDGDPSSSVSDASSITSSEAPAPTRDVWYLRADNLGGSLPCVMGRRHSEEGRHKRADVLNTRLWGSARGVSKSVKDIDFLPTYEMAMETLEENNRQ